MRNSIAPKPPSFASLVQQFFTEYLVAQRAVSPRTVACYRDALMLFLDFASRKLAQLPQLRRGGEVFRWFSRGDKISVSLCSGFAKSEPSVGFSALRSKKRV